MGKVKGYYLDEDYDISVNPEFDDFDWDIPINEQPWYTPSTEIDLDRDVPDEIWEPEYLGEWIMTNKEIYNTLVEIQGQLEDAYYLLPEYNANSDGKSSLDGARCDVSYLLDEVERTILDESSTFGGDTGVDADFGLISKMKINEVNPL